MKKPRENDVRVPIKAVGDIKRPRSWAVYGRSGAGKTTFSSTFPKPILLLDVRDRGTDSVADVKGLDVWEIEDWEDLDDVLIYLRHHPNKYKTLVIDTITQMQNLCIEFIMAKKGRTSKQSSRVGDFGSMSRREWGDASAAMKEKVTSFRDLPMETVFIAQEKTTHVDEDEEADQTLLLVPEVGPSAMKSVAAHLSASVNIVAHVYVRLRRFKQKVRGKDVLFEEPVYCLRLGAHPVYLTKARKPRGVEVSQSIEDPTHKSVDEDLSGK